MKFCPSCGVKLDNDGFKFCPECGYKFESNTNNSNQNKKSEPKGFIGGFLKGIRDQIPDEYVDKIKDNETIDDAVTHAKIIWHGPQTEKEKAYKERKRQEEENKDPINYKISEITGKHLWDSDYFTERKKLFNVSDGYTYYKDILKWEVANYDLEYDDLEARLDELLKIGDAKTIFELRFKHPTCLFKTREDLKNYIGHGTAKFPIPFTDEEIEKRKRDLDFAATLKNIQSKETDNAVNKIKETKQDDNQETEKPKVISATTSSEKESLTKQKIDEPDYNDLELSDLEESLIKTLPVINNPSEYEENIIKKYAEYNSEERKELLKDCWTITKLAEEHNIGRNEVQKAILTDEFLEKDLIGVFKVNPNNIRSLKILYRKPLTEAGQKQEAFDEINEEHIQESKINVNTEVEEVTVEEVTVENDADEATGDVVEEKVTNNEKSQQKEINKTFYNKKASNAKSLKKEFNNQLKFYIGSFRGSDDFKKRLIRHNKMFGDTNLYSIKNILKKEFENGKLALEDIEERIDELLELDVLALQHDVADKKHDSSIIKTQEDLNNYLGPEYVSKFKKKVDRKSKGEELFKKYNVNIENAHCFECKLAEQRRETVMTEFKENAWGNGYVALFDDRLVVIDETFLLKLNLGAEKVFFNNIDFINFEEGDENSPSTLYIGLRTKGQIILGYILPEDANKVIEKYEKYTGKDSSSEKTSNADELLKYADLYKQGLLSKEEFEAKKKELL